MRRLLLVAAALVVAGCSSAAPSGGTSTSAPGPSTSASPTQSGDATPSPSPSESVSPIAMRSLTPSTDTLSVTGKDAVELFTMPIPIGSDTERRVVRAVIVPSTVSDRLYVGQKIECTGPSGQDYTGIESGRNVVPDAKNQNVVAQFVFDPDEAGDWSCASKVRVCVPGKCSDGSAHGTISLAISENIADLPTRMAVSQPLPEWSQELRAGDDDVVIQSGDKGTMSTTIDNIPLDQGPVQFIGTISLTNCIEETYPAACKDVKDRGLQTDSNIKPTFTFTQQGGDNCASVTAKDRQGAYPQDISWKQHHGTYWFVVPNVDLNPDCDGSVQVDLTFEVTDGNGVVVERGTADKPTSVVGVIPSNPDLA